MIKKSVLMSLTSVISTLLGVVSQYFLARYLSVDDYGGLQLTLSWITIFGFFSLGSFNTVTTRAVAQKYPRFFITASKFCFLFSVVGSLAFLVVGYFYQRNLLVPLALVAAFFPFYAGINLGGAYYLGKAKFTKYARLIIFSQIVLVFSQIISVVLFKKFVPVVFFILFSTSIVNIYVSFKIFLETKKEKFLKERNKEFLAQGFQMTWLGILNSLGQKVQYIILGGVAGLGVLAMYSAAQLFPNNLRNIFKNSLNPLSIMLASISLERAIKFLRNSMAIMLIFGLLANLVVWVTLPLVVKIIFGNKYDASIEYAQLLSLIMFTVPINVLLSSLVVYFNFKRFYTFITLFSNVFKIALFAVLVPKFQIMGIVWAVLLSTYITTAVYLVWFLRLRRKNDFEKSRSIALYRGEKRNNDLLNIHITKEFNGHNLFKIVEADFLDKKTSYPFWIRFVAKLSLTKWVD